MGLGGQSRFVLSVTAPMAAFRAASTATWKTALSLSLSLAPCTLALTKIMETISITLLQSPRKVQPQTNDKAPTAPRFCTNHCTCHCCQEWLRKQCLAVTTEPRLNGGPVITHVWQCTRMRWAWYAHAVAMYTQ